MKRLLLYLAFLPLAFADVTTTPTSFGGPYCLSPTFGVAACSITTQYANGGVVFTTGAVTGTATFPDGGVLFTWGGISATGIVDLLSPVDAQIVVPGTTSQGVTSKVSVEAGFASSGNLLLSVFDTSHRLIASRVNGLDGLGPNGRSLITIATPGIAFFEVSTSNQDTFGVNQITIGEVSSAAPPPLPPSLPPSPLCNPSTLTFGNGGFVDTYQVHYLSNLNVGDSFINMTNAGTSSTSAFPTQNGNICANVFTFSADEQLVSCCSCLVTPDALISLSARNDLINNTLTPAVPTSLVVKLVASAASVGGPLVGGLSAWGTTLHATPTPGTFGATEGPFARASLSEAELTRVTALCGFIQSNGSGFGICRSCRLGGLGDVQP
jgi:hypothetical protein